MFFKWLISLYTWLNRNRPIVHITIIDGNNQYQIIKANFKSKLTPRNGEIIYFDSIGPYYSVIKIIHSINIRHTIWIVVKPIEMSALLVNDKKI